MLIIAAIVHLGKSGIAQKQMTDDDFDRMMFCLQVNKIKISLMCIVIVLVQVINERSASVENIFVEQCRLSLSHMLTTQNEEEAMTRKEKNKKKVIEHVDDHINFVHLTRTTDPTSSDDMFELSMNMAVSGTNKETSHLSNTKLNKVNYF